MKHTRWLKPVLVTTLLGGSLTLSVGASADIYKCMQADGTPLFTNIPEDKRCMLHLKTTPEPSPVAKLVEERATQKFRKVDRSRFDEHILAASREHGVEAALIHAVISAESGYNPLARSPKGAKGLMQLIPETGARYGANNLLDPRQNIFAGTKYLRDLIDMFGNDLKLAIAAYNAGEGAVIKYGAIPPYAETRNYVPKVLAYYKRYRQQYSRLPANGTTSG